MTVILVYAIQFLAVVWFHCLADMTYAVSLSSQAADKALL